MFLLLNMKSHIRNKNPDIMSGFFGMERIGRADYLMVMVPD